MIQVAAAIIENEQGQLLIARRKAGESQAGTVYCDGFDNARKETQSLTLVFLNFF